MIVAASNGSLHMLDLLLARHVDVEAEDSGKMTALLSAAAGGYKRCLKQLLDAG